MALTNDEYQKKQAAQAAKATEASSSGTDETAASDTVETTQANPTVKSAYDPTTDTAYTQANAALQAVNDKMPSYVGSYDTQIADLYNQIVNRDKFSYDINSDQLYQQYAQQYMDNGKLAMKDTMGQAAALTGGYGSSYGQAVGQQQYDAYLQQLNDVVPELYSQAYSMYQDEGDRMLQQYSLLGDLADDEYNKYTDAYSRWANERDTAQQAVDTAYTRGYNQWQDSYNIALNNAETLAASGDFSGYADIYGDETAAGMQQSWIVSNPDMAYQKGMITAAQYKGITGSYPVGYSTGSSGSGSSGSFEDSYYYNTVLGKGKDKDTDTTGGSGTKASYTLQELNDATAAGYSTAQITAALKDRGVDTSSKAVQEDIAISRRK